MVLMMLSIAFGGWIVWRRSPRYSAKRTIWTVVAMVLAGLIAGLVPVWLVPALPSRLQSVAIPVYIVFVLLVTLGVCAVILRVTDGPMAKPRPSARMVKVHRRTVQRIAKAIGLGLLLLAACDLILPGSYRGVGSMMAGFVAFCAIPALYGLHHKALRNDRAATSLNDNSWTIWRYTPTEWTALADRHFPRQDQTPPEFSLAPAAVGGSTSCRRPTS